MKFIGEMVVSENGLRIKSIDEIVTRIIVWWVKSNDEMNQWMKFVGEIVVNEIYLWKPNLTFHSNPQIKAFSTNVVSGNPTRRSKRKCHRDL